MNVDVSDSSNFSTNKYFQVLLSLNIDDAHVFRYNFFLKLGITRIFENEEIRKKPKKNQVNFLQIRLSFSIQDEALK